jgi:hypothetical protein
VNTDPRPTTTAVTRRTAFAGLGAGGLGLALGARPLDAAAQDAATEGHALVGTWYLDVDATDPANALEMFILHADGTYVEANADGTVRLGAWEATGPTTANLTIVAYTKDEGGTNLGATMLRLAITLNPDGDSYSAEGTIELIRPDGSSSGQAGPVGGAATRLVVEGPGTPVMTLDELFSAPAGTPDAATPTP